MRWIFGSQNQPGGIGSTNPYNGTRLYTWFFGQSSPEIINKGDRSTTYVQLRVRRTRASQRTQTQLRRWGERKHAVCASREEGYLPSHSRRSRVSTTTRRRRRLSLSSTTTSRVYLVFGECCNRHCKGTGKALVVVPITIRSHRLVGRPGVCARG